MKHLILLAIAIIISFASIGQDMKFKEADLASQVEYVDLKVQDTVYNAIITSKGSYKIERVSKSGNKYWMYLGYLTNEKFEEHPVWTNTDKTEYYYYVVSDSGYPLKRTLQVSD